MKKKLQWRFILLVILLCLGLGVVVARLIDLSVYKRLFLLKQSRARIFRVVKIAAYRGMITDRFGKPLAVSTPVSSVWVNPQVFSPSETQLQQLATILNMSAQSILQKVNKLKQREFVFIKRGIPPALGKTVKSLPISGLYLQPEYRRYYPDGEVSAHVIGFTDIDDQGREGLELAYNQWLGGSSGKEEVVKDRTGQIIADVAVLKQPKQGRDLTLSLDHRIQYLAYQSLKIAMNKYQATSGSIVVLNVKTGEILAMVNQPSYNPNNRSNKLVAAAYRNRAITDIFEPGSTIKPFNIALALESGQYTAQSIIDTNPGWLWVGGHKIRDDGLNYGVINLTEVLKKSSNVGAAKIMLSLQPQQYWKLLRDLGFGQRSKSGFPGEARGTLVERRTWQPSVVATLAYGYGIAVTTLQLAHAYAILAGGGLDIPVSFLKVQEPPVGKRVLRSEVAFEVNRMMESVVSKGGTGTRAQIKGYRVAGKTGTAYIANGHGYDRHRYISSFVGIAPASDPQLVVAVVVRGPKYHHFGGVVAAPIFSKVMSGALRLMGIPPDGLEEAE